MLISKLQLCQSSVTVLGSAAVRRAAFRGAAFRGAAFRGAAFRGAAFRGAAFWLAAFWALGMQPASAAGPAWQGAATRVVITPSPERPMWMGGYAARSKPAEGKVHDLHAKVLVLEDHTGHRAAIVTLDLLGVTPQMRSLVAAQAAQHGIDDASLLLNASHTHCGPELRDDRMRHFGIEAEYAARARAYSAEKASWITRCGCSRTWPTTRG